MLGWQYSDYSASARPVWAHTKRAQRRETRLRPCGGQICVHVDVAQSNASAGLPSIGNRGGHGGIGFAGCNGCIRPLWTPCMVLASLMRRKGR
eukprot:361223-Chlamydomonas_euryale.AAC.4